MVDDPFFAAEAQSPANAHIALLGNDDSFAEEGEKGPPLLEKVAGAPLTLWTIPEISSVGLTEEDALEQGMKKASNGGSV